MIEEIEKRLADGEIVELECVDRIGLLKDIDRSEANEKILDQGSLVVDYIDYDGDIRLVGEIGDLYFNVIVSEEFKYFRIKEPSATFNDLIDVAVQAYKDGVCDSVEIDINNWLIVKSSTGNIHCHKNHLIHDNEFHINWIKSLYKETFVIETEEDLARFNKDVEITFANDEKLSWEDLKSIGLMNTHAIFKALKGATVTQKRDK